jgi:hypothetical protein
MLALTVFFLNSLLLRFGKTSLDEINKPIVRKAH